MMKKLYTVCFIAAVIGMIACGAASAAERDTPERRGDYLTLTAGAAVQAGNMACVWTNGLAYMAADTANYRMLGRAETTVAAGETLKVKRGIFRWANRGAFTDKDINDVCYVWTNGAFSVTTAATAANDIKAGRIVAVDSGVWVEMSTEPLVSATPATLAVAGNATVGGTLGVTGAATFADAAIKMTALPTSTNGLAVGTLWNSSGTVKVFTE
jgi:hypothetical protein